MPLEQSHLFRKQMKDAGNTCDLITVPGGIHGMGDWNKLGSGYQEHMILWLKEKLK